MKKQGLRLLTLTLIGMLIYSCQNDDDFVKEDITSIQQTKPENITKLGEKLENPFSVTNMQRALDTILKEVKKLSSKIISEIGRTNRN